MTVVRIITIAVLTFACVSAVAQTERPNIVLIIADDLGYTDIGAFGSEIRTPNLDRLANDSVIMTNMHALPVCAPTRAMMLAGTDHHTAGLGTMYGERWLPELVGQTGYERYLHERVAIIPERLADAGYHTYMAGKWHLGRGEGQRPHERGFERSFVLHAGYGTHLTMKTDRHLENGVPPESPDEDFYSSRTYTDKLIEYIDEQRADDRPFFAYAAYTAPHWPLQAPDDYIDRYAGVYDDGFEAVRTRRLRAATRLGVVPSVEYDASLQWVGSTWDELSDEEQRHYARRMEVYAAMVESLDYHIGRLINYLEQTDELDNTVLLFMSDNGAESDEIDRNPLFRFFPENADYDNSLQNLGHVKSFVGYGQGWAQVSSAPFSRFKGFINEGGTRVPAFLLHGNGTTNSRLDAQFLTAIDIAPTVLELAGVNPARRLFNGREVAQMTGRSFAGLLTGETDPIYAADEAFTMELNGSRAVWRGRYKLVWEQPGSPVMWGQPIPDSWYQWQLYDLEADPGETRDISNRNPRVVRELLQVWEQYAETNNVVRDARLRVLGN